MRCWTQDTLQNHVYTSYVTSVIVVLYFMVYVFLEYPLHLSHNMLHGDMF